MSEHAIQNSIRNALAGKCITFRVNIGQAWTGEVHRLPNGDLLIKKPRPFNTGLPSGFSDLLTVTKVTVTQEMVGEVIGQAGFIEVKDKGGPTPKQQAFLNAMRANGARAGVARSPEDAVNIALGPMP